MIALIKDQCEEHGVEPIGRVLSIAPSTSYECIAIEHHPDRASDRRHLHLDRWRSSAVVGDSYDNALAETIIGLFKTEVIN